MAGIFTSTDLFEDVSFNPLGHFMEPKTVSDNDDREREISVIENTKEPEWGTVNYGSLSALKNTVTDANGNSGVAVGDSEPMMDMTANADIASKVAPLPKGLTIHTLPGVQPGGSKLNSFVFSPVGSSSLMAPRNYYLSTASVTAKATDKGAISKTTVTKEMVQYSSQEAASSSITIFQVPFGEEFMISDTTGTVKKASDSQQMATAINKTLNQLTKLHNDKANSGQLSKVLFSNSGLSTEFNNVNAMINTGRYAKAYKNGLTTALGTNENGVRDLPGILIKSDINNQDLYGQFDYIYNSMKSGAGKAYYSPELVKWAQNNADSVIHLLMVNYMLQSQFTGTSGSYVTPITLNKWQENKLPFYKDLVAKGKKSKEPFFLYTSIDPTVVKKVGEGKTTPKIPTKYIQPDLAYIFALYTSIQSQVWIGATGNNVSGSTSQVWQDTVSDMNKKIKANKVKEGKTDLPKDANKVSNTLSDYSHNNLVSGLSTNRGSAKGGTAEVYPNKEIIGALRALFSGGESGNDTHITLLGKQHKITPIGNTKYTSKGEVSYLYRAFAYGSSDMYARWAKMITAASDTPLQPAIFSSNWDSTGQAAYIMMPTMLGGVDFPKSLKIMMDDLLKSKDETLTYTSLSNANRYIMAFNFKPNAKAKTSNTKGIVEVKTGAEMGTVLNIKKPIVLSGYVGTESFSIVDYFKVQDALNGTYDSPPLEAKTTAGKSVKLKYLNLFKDFFTIPTEKALIGTGKGEIKYAQGFDKEGYKTKYQANKSKSAITQISPDYTLFFDTTTAEAK